MGMLFQEDDRWCGTIAFARRGGASCTTMTSDAWAYARKMKRAVMAWVVQVVDDGERIYMSTDDVESKLVSTG